MTIEETIKSLSQTYNVKVEKTEKTYAPLSYISETDTILYNPPIINEIYREFRKYGRITLKDFITHVFGHELAHRKKYKSYKEAAKIEYVLMTFFYEPQRALESLSTKQHYPLWRAASATYMLFEEYYAVKENPLHNPFVHRIDTAIRAKALKEKLQDIRKLMHAVVIAPPEPLKHYLISSIAFLPTKYFRIFPEYLTIRKIKLYLENEITTPSDVFNLRKIQKVAEIFLYEL